MSQGSGDVIDNAERLREDETVVAGLGNHIRSRKVGYDGRPRVDRIHVEHVTGRHTI